MFIRLQDNQTTLEWEDDFLDSIYEYTYCNENKKPHKVYLKGFNLLKQLFFLSCRR